MTTTHRNPGPMRIELPNHALPLDQYEHIGYIDASGFHSRHRWPTTFEDIETYLWEQWEDTLVLVQGERRDVYVRGADALRAKIEQHIA